MSIVEPAMRSSSVYESGLYQAWEGMPAPKEERPRARRKT